MKHLHKQKQLRPNPQLELMTVTRQAAIISKNFLASRPLAGHDKVRDRVTGTIPKSKSPEQVAVPRTTRKLEFNSNSIAAETAAATSVEAAAAAASAAAADVSIIVGGLNCRCSWMIKCRTPTQMGYQQQR